MVELPPFDALALSLHHSPGVHAVIVGSGLSRAAGIPTGWEVTIDLVRRLAALDGVMEHNDWAEWYRLKHNREPNYSEIIDALASTPAERRAILHSYIEQAEGEEARRPSKAHHELAGMVASGAVRVIITTNFDRLIENALRDAGIEPTVIASADAISGATPLVHSKCTVIKVHGDYLDARIKNTDAELSEYAPEMDALLDIVFDNFGILAVGWSGEWDAALRSAVLRAPSRRYPFYWAARGKLSGLAQDLVVHRAGRIVPIVDADTFFSKLAQTLAALKQASRPHPQSVEMAIALARRLCRDDNFAMEWAEFLHAEVSKIIAYVTGQSFPTQAPTAETITEIVMTITRRAEVLRRASLVCGRWGTSTANLAISNAIRDLDFSGGPHVPYKIYSVLRDLGASLAFYWNLVGLVERADWGAIRNLLEFKLKRENAKTTIVAALPFLAYDEAQVWTFIEGFTRHHTPASDYAVEVLKGDISDISLSKGHAEELFDQVEFLIMLVASSARLERMKASDGLWFFAPFGRFVWRHPGWSQRLKEIESQLLNVPIFQSGLLGTAAHAKATIEEVRQFLSRAGGRWV